MATLSSIITPSNILTASNTATLTNKTINFSSNTLVATSAQLAAAVTDETGTGALVFASSPVLGGIVGTASGNLRIDPATQIVEVLGDGSSVVGQIQLNCHVNTHGQKIASQPHSQAASNTLTLPGGTTIGDTNATLVSDTGTQTLTNKTISGANNTLTVDGTNPVGFKNIPQSGSAKTASYTLVTGDVGKFIEVGASGSITIPDATFSAGDVLSIFNNTAGDITITCTITTAFIAGADTDEATVDLATRGICTVLFISGTVCVISGNVAP